ncbi:MAG: FG-GAP repeat protein [Bdellovibrionales bacterium]|nr:FG-GAP repeat protein [Oligoflexia bacterium]
MGLALQSCSGLGYQGGVIPTTFAGISKAEAVSPQTLSLTWNPYPGATKYNVYTPDQNAAIYTPGFTNTLFKPLSSDPNIEYQYSVTASDPITGTEQGDRTAYTKVKLLPHFNYKDSGSVTALSKTSIRVNWVANSSVTYKVYVAERLPTGQVNYNSFIASATSVKDQASAVVSNLLEGREYCAVAIAAYSDETNDAPDGVGFVGDPATKLSSASYSVGPSGNFGDSIIARSQKCVRTISDFNVSSIKIYSPKATLSNRPVFYISVPGDISEDSSGTVSSTIYQFNETTGLSSLVGSRVGTGRIIAQAAMPTGKYKFFAIVNDLSGSNAQAKVELLVAPNFAPPVSDQDRKYVYVRSFDTVEDSVNPTGYFPEKQQGGFGSQLAGAAVAVGDFNCDGKADIAIGVPQASVMAADNRPAKQGKVVIYFDTTSTTPATTTRSQTITFDITGFSGTDSARDLQLGTSLFVGNFNNDNQQTNQPVAGVSSGLNKNFRCDDLAIGSGYGPMFMLYGKRDVTGNDGGLNYVGPTSYSINPSASCDPTSNVCQPAVYTSGINPIGAIYTSGDYNGDGYEDLAAASGLSSTRGIWVFRGSEYGLIAPLTYPAEGIATTAGTYSNFPYIPLSPAGFAAPAPAPAAGWGAGGFGGSISTLHNAFYDIDASGNGSKRIRDVLLIGNTYYNQVHACIPTSNYALAPGSWGTIGSANDVNSGFYWDCSKVIPAPTLSSGSVASGFGSAMTDIKNALRYRPDQFTVAGCTPGFGNCNSSTLNLGYPGAAAISSVNQSSVYIYYMVNSPISSVTTRDNLGRNRNSYLNQMFANPSTLSVTSNTPCSVNTGLSTEACQIQEIRHPTSGAGSFGYNLSSLTGNVAPSVDQAKDSILAVAAPFKNFTLSGGAVYKEVGSVQLFSQNSRFASNPIVVKGTTACDSTSVCRYSDGFSNSLTTAIDYDGTLTDNIHFGMGGMVAGPLMPTADNSAYSSNSDIVIGAPGHVARITDSGSTYSVIDNGGAFAYFSQAGVYRNYRIVDSSGPTPWHIMDQSFSQESDMKFHQAISLGDINQDGIGEVAVRISQGSRNSIRIYNGRSDKISLDRNPGGSVTFQVQGDRTAGARFVPVGKIFNSTLPSFLVTGANASYLFFTGIGGLVQGFPSAFGLGGTPRKLFAPYFSLLDSNFTFVPVRPIQYLDFSDRAIYNSETLGSIDTTLNNYTPFAHGDFNGDGIEDFAIGFNGAQSIADTTNSGGAKKCTSTLNYCGTEGVGRVMIFYGGADNGLQTQPDSNGGYPMMSTFFSDYKSDASLTPRSNFGDPCSTTGSNCKIQMLHEPATLTYGSTLASVPAGSCADANSVLHPVNALVVASSTAGGPLLYLYRPRCLDATTPNSLSGLVGYNDASGTGGFTTTNSTLPIPAGSSSTLGISMTAVSKLMGTAPAAPASSNLTSHLVVTDQSNSRILVYPVHSIDSNKENFETYDTSNPTALNDGARKVDYSGSAMLSTTNGNATMFGSGVSSIGDINGDGYADVAISISKLNRQDTSSQSIAQGAILVLFGGKTGLQSHSNAALTSIIEPAKVASCFVLPVGALPTSTCNPTLLYTPQAANSIRDGSYERSFISPYSAVDVGPTSNEGLGTFLIGIPGKDSLDTLPNKRILQGGAFYELP